MFRDESWEKGVYIDGHKKYECCSCQKEFIVGEKLVEDCPPGYPVCPYCGATCVECTVWTDDNQLEVLASDMGCLAIYIDLPWKKSMEDGADEKCIQSILEQ